MELAGAITTKSMPKAKFAGEPKCKFEGCGLFGDSGAFWLGLVSEGSEKSSGGGGAESGLGEKSGGRGNKENLTREGFWPKAK